MLSFIDMSVLKRLLPYIILNILVSALVTVAVLTWWNGGGRLPALDQFLTLPTQTLAPGPDILALRTPEEGQAQTRETAPPATPEPVQPSATPQPATVKLIEIAEVSGAGNLGAEVILLRRVGDGELRLNSWKLDDEVGHRYTFPDMVLFKSGAVRIYTRTGANTVNELFWGLKEAVWTSGKTATLTDDQGNLRASFVVP